MSLEFRMFGPGLDPADTLCVDGRAFGLRSLSHWPGPPPPPELAHDVTTGMALAYARLSPQRRLELLGRFGVVVNDHYDTDGALSLFAMIQPDVALRHADLMVRTALTGDFRTWHGEDALAVDLTVWAALMSTTSPLRGQLDAIDDYMQASELCYRWVLDQLPAVLDDPFAWRSLWTRRFDRVLDERRRLLAGEFEVERREDLDLAVIHVREPLARHTLVAAAGELSRMLIVHASERGHGYRFCYRNESWFLRLRDRTAPRYPLAAAAEALARLEGEPSAGEWWYMKIDQTSPQLGFGSPDNKADVFNDLRVDLDPASRLCPAQVIEILAETLAPPADPTKADPRS